MTDWSLGQQPRTVSAMLVLKLRELILSGEIPPGSRLHQNEIAERFDVSTTPVREAFTVLSREGLVKAETNRGVQVFTPTLRDALDAAQIQEILEGACIAASAPNLTDADLARARQLLDEHRQNTPQTRRRGLELDTAFHLSLLVGCPNGKLHALAESARRDTLTHRLVLIAIDEPTGEYVRTVHAQHEAIFAACARRDGAEAAERTVDHIRWSAHVFAEPDPASKRGQTSMTEAPTADNPSTASAAGSRTRL